MNERPNLDEIIQTLENQLKNESLQQTVSAHAPRFPHQIKRKELKPDDGTGELCLFPLSPADKEKLDEERKKVYEKHPDANDDVFFGGMVLDSATITSGSFLTKEGSFFALSPFVKQEGRKEEFIAQNLEDHSWAVVKTFNVDEGNDHTMSENDQARLKKFSREKEILNKLNLSKGTLTLGGKQVYIEPYVYGKSYQAIIEEAIQNDKNISVETAYQMILGALKAVKDLQNKHYTHSNLTLENIVWDSELKHCTLIDLSACRKAENKHHILMDMHKLGKTIETLLMHVTPSQDEKYKYLQTLKDDLISTSSLLEDVNEIKNAYENADSENQPNSGNVFLNTFSAAYSVLLKGLGRDPARDPLIKRIEQYNYDGEFHESNIVLLSNLIRESKDKEVIYISSAVDDYLGHKNLDKLKQAVLSYEPPSPDLKINKAKTQRTTSVQKSIAETEIKPNDLPLAEIEIKPNYLPSAESAQHKKVPFASAHKLIGRFFGSIKDKLANKAPENLNAFLITSPEAILSSEKILDNVDTQRKEALNKALNAINNLSTQELHILHEKSKEAPPEFHEKIQAIRENLVEYFSYLKDRAHDTVKARDAVIIDLLAHKEIFTPFFAAKINTLEARIDYAYIGYIDYLADCFQAAQIDTAVKNDNQFNFARERLDEYLNPIQSKHKKVIDSLNKILDGIQNKDETQEEKLNRMEIELLKIYGNLKGQLLSDKSLTQGLEKFLISPYGLNLPLKYGTNTLAPLITSAKKNAPLANSNELSTNIRIDNTKMLLLLIDHTTNESENLFKRIIYKLSPERLNTQRREALNNLIINLYEIINENNNDSENTKVQKIKEQMLNTYLTVKTQAKDRWGGLFGKSNLANTLKEILHEEFKLDKQLLNQTLPKESERKFTYHK